MMLPVSGLGVRFLVVLPTQQFALCCKFWEIFCLPLTALTGADCPTRTSKFGPSHQRGQSDCVCCDVLVPCSRMWPGKSIHGFSCQLSHSLIQTYPR